VRWTGAIVLVASAASIPFAGCGKSCARTGGPVAAKKSLVLGTLEEPETLDPAFTESSGAQEIARLLFRDLTEFGDDWTVHPSLAEAGPAIETTTSAAMRVHWRLRPNLRWSDGEPLTSRDVVFGHLIASDPTLDVAALRPPKEIARVLYISPLEFSVEWSEPNAGYDAPRLHAILPRHAYPDPKTSPRPFRGLARAPISNGPFRIRSWSPGQYLVLEPNPNWPLDRPRLETITFRFFKTEDSFEAELATGGIDALGEASGMSIERAEGLAERLSGSHAVTYVDSGLWLHIELRLDHPLLGDVRVRRAISRAIDREDMGAVVYGRHATPAIGFLPPRHPAHVENPDEQAGADPREAKRLLAEAKVGPNAKLELQFASGSQASERAAAFVKDALSKVGIEVVLEGLPFRVLVDKMKSRAHAPMVLYAWRSGPDWDGNAMLHSGGRQNYGGFADAEIDRWLDAARHTSDVVRWIASIRGVEARYEELLPTIPLLFRQAVSVHPRHLTPWRPTGTTTPVTWNAELWHFE
jgi:peptide/nickel transport system substrate-binding protein